MRSSNPALKTDTFRGLPVAAEAMTVPGTVNKTGILLLLVIAAAAFVWNQPPAAVLPFIAVGTVGGLVLALVTIFAKRWAALTSPVYAVCEGLALGGISAVYEAAHPGIVINAAGLTLATLAALLLAYSTRIVRVTDNFKLGVVAATGGITLVYLVDLVLQWFGRGVPYIHDAGPLGIGVSLAIVIVAALNLVLDFDFIETGAAARAPRYMEWYAAFGLLVTLVWLYLEILRLLGKSRGRGRG
jgi:uncharacterized YccA/Bax inhibitor family protein